MNENITESITINLHHSSNATSFGNSTIHKYEYYKIREKIRKRIADLKDFQNKDNSPNNYLDTITVLGTRGSGKTSFLLSIADLCKNDANFKNKIEIIDIIDPTLIEAKGHIFLTIIAQICKKVNKQLKKNNSDIDKYEVGKKKEWKECLKKLAGGLPTIDGVGGAMSGWDDAEHIMNLGLNSVESASDLANNFHKLIEKALVILNKKAFVLMLDDIDIDFLKGWPVLETVRKYLTTPQIITFVSGDIHLFSKAVRKIQWKNFGKALVVNEGEHLERMANYNETVTAMESQYLQKVLKPENRVTLTTLLEKYNLDIADFTDKFKLQKKDDKSEVTTLIDEYNRILKLFGIYNSYQQEAYRSYLLSLPLRSQIQFLMQLKDCSEIKEVRSDCIDIFLSDLYEKEVNVDLAKSTPKYLCSIILKLLINSKELDAAYQLQPTTLDHSLNGCLMAFTILFSIHGKKYPYLIFDYLIKIGYIRNLLSQLGYSNENSEVNKSVKSRNIQETRDLCIEGLIKHSALYFDRNYRDSMCYATSYIRAFKDKSMGETTLTPYAGSICVYSEKTDINDHTLRSEFNNKNGLIQAGLIPASYLKNSSSKTVLFYSIYNLLGAIAEIMKVNSTDINQASKYLRAMSQLRAYPIPIEGVYGTSNRSGNDNGALSDDDQERSINTVDNELWVEIKCWIDKFQNTTINVSPHLLGKISTRIHYSIESIDNTNSNKEKLGSYFSKYIIAIMNAILVEDARETVAPKEGINGENELTLSNDNPVAKSKFFIQNLKSAKEYISKNNSDLIFSKWLLSCPLLVAYIESKEVETELKLFIGGENYSKLSISDKLNDIPIRYVWADRSIKLADTAKPIFSTSTSKNEQKIKATVETIKKHFDYNGFIESKVPTPAFKEVFDGTISKERIKKVKDYIVKNKIKW